MKEKRLKPSPGEKHVTTICGPQAEAIIKAEGSGTWVNKSVPGLAIVKLWADDSSEYWG